MNVVFLGSARNGKSCIISQLVHGVFDRRYKPTVAESYTLVVQQPDGLCSRLNIFDTSGSDEFPEMREMRIQQSDVCVVVYSVTCRASFDYAIRMSRTIRKIKENYAPIVLVGNKTDKTSERVVTYEDGYRVMRDRPECYFLETNARYGDNISRIVDVILLLKDTNRDQTELKRRLSVINTAKRVSDPSVSTRSYSDLHSLDLWSTPLKKDKRTRKRKKFCSLM